MKRQRAYVGILRNTSRDASFRASRISQFGRGAAVANGGGGGGQVVRKRPER